MICKVRGKIEAVQDGKLLLQMEGGLTYELLLPTYAQARLGGMIGQAASLETLHYLEGSSQGSNFTPRLAGFLTPMDKAFFELFISVKGIGPRKALRAMALETGRIAGAIADRDAKLLQSLPEIGQRMAETIIASLHGKVDRFVAEAAYAGTGGRAASGAAAGAGAAEMESAGGSSRRALARQTLEVLLQLGENRVQALTWIDEALRKHPEVDQPHDLLTRALEVKAGG